MEIKLYPLLEVRDLLQLTAERLQALPDIIDIRCGNISIALYFYPVSSWHFGFGCLEDGSIILPTMLVERNVF